MTNPTPKKPARMTRARALAAIRKLVDEQAEDHGLWCEARTIVEAYLQQELRKLHAVIEGAGDE